MNKNLKISKEAHTKLMKYGNKDETFDDVIKRLLKEADKNEDNKTRT